MTGFKESPDMTLTQEDIREADYREKDATKLRTANTFEQLMYKANMEYEELFGLRREMKALLELGAEPPRGTRETMLMDIQEYREYLTRTQPDLSEDGLDFETLVYGVQAYVKGDMEKAVIGADGTFRYVDRDPSYREILQHFTPLPQEERLALEELLHRFSDDRFLYIGDPFEYVNQRIDKGSVTTVERSVGIKDAIESTRDTSLVAEEIEDSYRSYKRPGYETYWQEVADWLNIEPDLTQHEDSGDYDTEWVIDLDSAVHEAKLLTEHATNPAIVRDAIDSWREVNRLLYERRKHYLQEGTDVTDPDQNYNTEFGLSPIDGLSKVSWRMSHQALDGLTVIEHYTEDVYPRVFWRYVEHLAEAHFEPSDVATPEGIAAYQSEWQAFLGEKGVDTTSIRRENFGFVDSGPSLVDLLYEFYRERGVQLVENIDPLLYLQMKKDEIEALNIRIPYIKKSRHAELVEATYPYTQEALADRKYERIVASWSITAHAMPNMTEDEITEIWEETDRLLTDDGIATFFPIGHYGNSAAQIGRSLDAYREKTGSKIAYHFHKSGDERFPDDDVLVITKE